MTMSASDNLTVEPLTATDVTVIGAPATVTVKLDPGAVVAPSASL